jgi:hypothetical protein
MKRDEVAPAVRRMMVIRPMRSRDLPPAGRVLACDEARCA